MEKLLTLKVNEYCSSKTFLRFKKARAKAKEDRLKDSRVEKSNKIILLASIVEKYIYQKKLIN